MTGNNPKAILDNYGETFNDGRWHQSMLIISTNSLILNVDNRPTKTTRLLTMSTGSEYLVGGQYCHSFNLNSNNVTEHVVVLSCFMAFLLSNVMLVKYITKFIKMFLNKKIFIPFHWIVEI